MTRGEAIAKLKIDRDYLCKMSSMFDANEVAKPFNMAIEALERKHGEWIPIKDDEHWYVLRWECSCCGFWTTSNKRANYCEDCGADMRGGDANV